MAKVRLVCPSCGTVFYRYKSQNAKYCSRNCGFNHHRISINESIRNEYLYGLSLHEIAINHKVSTETIRRRLKKQGVTFRLKTEHMKTRNPMKGKTHTESSKEKMRVANRRQFSSDNARSIASHNTIRVMSTGGNRKVSKIEDIVASELDNLGISYKRQASIRDTTSGMFIACADFLLNDNRVLEVNGTYWHCDPRFYPDGPKHPSQFKTVTRYENKKMRFERLGIVLIEVWESDIKSNVKDAVFTALNGLKNA